MSEQKQVAVLRPVRVERAGKRGQYAWRDGYAITMPNGNEVQPWMTKAEAKAYCKGLGLDVRIEGTFGG